MQQSNSNNQKIRSILAAMEKSIDVARRKRLNQPDDVSDSIPEGDRNTTENVSKESTHSSAFTRLPSPPSINGAGENGDPDTGPRPSDRSTPDDAAAPQRQKARPKRPSEFFHPRGESTWQSKVG